MNETFFGIQLAVQSPPHDPWRDKLCRLLREHTRDLSTLDQRGLLGSIANHLLAAEARWSLGFWDFVPEGRAEYDDWARGIEDDSAETWAPDRSGAKLDHALVSVLLALPRGSISADVVAERCDLDEATWTQRATFRHLVEVLPMLHVASVRSDAIYVTPGSTGEAFSLRELRGEGYEYLLPIE